MTHKGYNNINNKDNDAFFIDSPSEVLATLASRVRQRRLEKNLSRKALAELSGVPMSTITKFERSHSISLSQFTALVIALGYVDELKSILSAPRYTTLSELENIKANQNRKRGRAEKDR